MSFFKKKEKPKEEVKKEVKRPYDPYMLLVTVEDLGGFSTTSPTAESMVKFCNLLDEIGGINGPCGGEYRAVGILYRKKKVT